MDNLGISRNALQYMMIAVGAIVFFLLVVLVKKLAIDRPKKRKEDKMVAIMDQMAMRRASINTAYLEKDFNKTVTALVGAYYSLDPQGLPTKNISPDLYMEWYKKLKREYELGIQKKVYDFKMTKSRVTKQDNSSMYGVFQIEMEAEFAVDFFYNHVTQQKRSIRKFTQAFVFLNVNNGWVLDKALQEVDVSEEIVSM